MTTVPLYLILIIQFGYYGLEGALNSQTQLEPNWKPKHFDSLNIVFKTWKVEALYDKLVTTGSQ
jgi:hypothetical protein